MDQQPSNVETVHAYHYPGAVIKNGTVPMVLTRKIAPSHDNAIANSSSAGKRTYQLLHFALHWFCRSFCLLIFLIALAIFRRRCIPREWLCDHDYDCGPFDKSDEDESLCQFKEKCLPNQSECASPSGTGAVCIDTEMFCNGQFDCVNDEYTEYCGKNITFFLEYLS